VPKTCATCVEKFRNLAARKDNINNVEETYIYDNYVQDPTSQQSFNRYAYCVYNPLKYVDPSGERYFGPWLPDITAAIEREARQRCFHEQYRMNEEIEFMNMMCKLGMLEFSWGDDKLEGGGTHDNSGSGGGDKSNGGMMQADTSGAPAGDGEPTFEEDNCNNVTYGGDVAVMNDDYLKESVKDIFGIEEGVFVSVITTMPSEGYYVDAYGRYVNEDGDLVAGYCSGIDDIEIHISPYCLDDEFDLISTFGHELIHAYHKYMMGYDINRQYSEWVAYKYSWNALMLNGCSNAANKLYFRANFNGFWGNPPANYNNVPYGLPYPFFKP